MIDSLKINFRDGTSQIVKLPEHDNYCHAFECLCNKCFKNKFLLIVKEVERNTSDLTYLECLGRSMDELNDKLIKEFKP